MDRLEDRITKNGECWIWTASKSGEGYGIHYVNNKGYSAHRAVYESLVGEIPEGHQLHHICQNKLCVNPDHLMPMTHQQHRAAHREEATHCPHGHEYTDTNTFYSSEGYRKCRLCHNQKTRDYMRRKRLDNKI